MLKIKPYKKRLQIAFTYRLLGASVTLTVASGIDSCHISTYAKAEMTENSKYKRKWQ